jgi:hypothetical protein
MGTAGDPAGNRWGRWPVLASAIVGAALIACLSASSASAFHIPGADYSGAASGGGSISFSVSSDGSSVTNLTLTGVHTGDCSLDSAHYTQPTPISNNSFDNGEVSGSFPNVRGAYGRFDIPALGLLTSCRVSGTWSAITTADPAGSKECKSAQARARKTKRALRNAMGTGNEAKIKKLQKKWKKARSRRDQFC